jgi:hypothetical protein
MKPHKSCEYYLAVLLRHAWLKFSCKMPLCAEQLLERDSQGLHEDSRSQDHQEAVLADALESGPIGVMIERVSCCARRPYELIIVDLLFDVE